MSDEIAGLFVSIGADLSGLDFALEDTRLRLENLQAEGGLLGQLPVQVPQDVQKMVVGMQTALNPLPQMLENGLKKPIVDVMDSLSKYIDQEVQKLINKIRYAANTIHAAAAALGGSSSGGGGATQGRASGGPVSGGTPYIVGEKGPELFVPGSSGGIIPNHALDGGGLSIRGGTFHIYGVQDAEGLYDQLQRIARQRGG